MSHSVILHQFEISPFCQKVAKALRHKGIAFEAIDYNGMASAKAQTLSKVGKVPVLDIDGKRIQDSTKIVRYLDEAYPDLPRLYPVDLLEKAQVELWEDWSDELLYWFEVNYRANDPVALDAAVSLAMTGRPAYERPFVKPSLKIALKMQLMFQGLGRMAKEDVDAEFLRHLDRIDLVLAKSGWLVGAQKTIADLSVGTQLAEVVRTSAVMRPQILARPHIAKWLGQL
jgi:glutathione S-transferase